jgi:hypothetical protein
LCPEEGKKRPLLSEAGGTGGSAGPKPGQPRQVGGGVKDGTFEHLLDSVVGSQVGVGQRAAEERLASVSVQELAEGTHMEARRQDESEIDGDQVHARPVSGQPVRKQVHLRGRGVLIPV